MKERGAFGYTQQRKMLAIAGVILMAILGVTIFLIGYFINNDSNKNMFTVVAVLFTLPGAKFLVRYIILFKSQKVSVDEYENVKKIGENGCKLYSQVVITSKDKVMYVDYIAVKYENVIVKISKNQKDKEYIQDYLKKGVQNWGENYKVVVFDEQKKFENALKRIGEKDIDEKEYENVNSYIRSLIV